MLRAVHRFHVYFILTFDSKVIATICYICCNLITIGINCSKYKHPLSKMKDEFPLLSKEEGKDQKSIH